MRQDLKQTRLAVYGLGKLGLPLAASFAAAGLRTFGIDTNASHVAALQRGEIPIVEPGLDELLRRGAATLSYHTAPEGLEISVSLIQVPTPSTPQDPFFSARHVVAALQTICGDIRQRAQPPGRHLVILASTVMPGTVAAQLRPVLDAAQQTTGCSLKIAYVPDLVAIGDVVRGFRKPPTLVIGADDDLTRLTVGALYDFFVEPEVPRAMLSVAEAEIVKVAWNFYFCFKVSFANLLARVADHAGDVSVDRITETLAGDPRIGRGFLKAGMPFGGPCLPRDVDAMGALLALSGEGPGVAEAVRQSNDRHYDHIVDVALRCAPGPVGVLGLAFKAGTDVTVESPSCELIGRLLDAGRAVQAYDPSPRVRAAVALEPRAAGARICSGVEQFCAAVDVVVVAVNNPALLSIVQAVAPGTQIVDPWGLMPVDTAGVVRPGRAGWRSFG